MKKPRILLLQPEGDRLLCSRLEKEGWEVARAHTVETAKTRLQDGSFNLLLVEHELPGDCGGLEFVTGLRNNTTPVILLSSAGGEPLVLRALRAGVRDFFKKSPGYLNLLMPAVKRALGAGVPARAEGSTDARLLGVLESALDAIFVVDAEGRVSYLNPAARSMFACTREDTIGRPIARLLPQDFDAHSGLAKPESLSQTIPMLTRGIRADGASFPVEVTFSKHQADARKLYTIIVRDATVREQARLLEERLRQAQKLEAIGRLAGGVAHDFNNLLTLILGYTDFLLREVSLEDSIRELLLHVDGAGHRAARLTDQLLAFGRRQTVMPEPLHLGQVVNELARMLRRLIGTDVHMDFQQDEELATVLADRTQIEQILLNLVINACDAMPRGGQLGIEVRNGRVPAGNPFGVAAGAYVTLAVADSGAGITPETRRHLFEPFFTTKDHKGTGLGLATVYGIVKQNHGFIDVQSEVGAGALFRVGLPVSKQAAAASAQPIDRDLPSGQGNILLVEDDVDVRRLTSRALEGAGYQIVEAANGREALEAAAGLDCAIDLLVTDVIMPGMNGVELAHKLAGKWPALRVLYVSGHDDEMIARHELPLTQVAYVKKPFLPGTLARKVQQILEPRQAPRPSPPTVSAEAEPRAVER